MNNEGQYVECTLCHERFYGEESIKAHTREIRGTDGKRHVCIVCSFQDSLQAALRTQLVGTYRCTQDESKRFVAARVALMADGSLCARYGLLDKGEPQPLRSASYIGKRNLHLSTLTTAVSATIWALNADMVDKDVESIHKSILDFGLAKQVPEA